MDRPGLRPDQEVAEQDLIEAIQEQFSEEELEILTLWLDDMPWAAIGQKLGCSGDAARVRLNQSNRSRQGEDAQRRITPDLSILAGEDP